MVTPAHRPARLFLCLQQKSHNCTATSSHVQPDISLRRRKRLSPHLRFMLYSSHRSFAKASRASDHNRIGGRSCAYLRSYLIASKSHQRSTKGNRLKVADPSLRNWWGRSLKRTPDKPLEPRLSVFFEPHAILYIIFMYLGIHARPGYITEGMSV